MPLLKLPPVWQREHPCPALVLHDEMRWEGLVNKSNEIRAKVWLGLVSLPCVISYFQTAHHRGEKNREEEKLLGGHLSVFVHSDMQSY